MVKSQWGWWWWNVLCLFAFVWHVLYFDIVPCSIFSCGWGVIYNPQVVDWPSVLQLGVLGFFVFVCFQKIILACFRRAPCCGLVLRAQVPRWPPVHSCVFYLFLTRQSNITSLTLSDDAAMRMMLMWRAGGELAWCLVDTCDSLLWAKLSNIHLLTHNVDAKMKAI